MSPAAPRAGRSDVPVSRFRRDEYSSPDFRNCIPKWHLSAEPIPRDWRDTMRYFTARCGYRYDAILGGVRASNAKTPPKGPQCKDCLRDAARRGVTQ